MSRSTETIALLVDKESDLSAQDHEGKSSSYAVIDRRDKKTVRLLVDREVKVTSIDRCKRSFATVF